MILPQSLTLGLLLFSAEVAAELPAGEPPAAAAAEPKAGDSAQPAKQTSPQRQTNVTISKETTYLLGPLRADGYVDYAAALNDECRRGVAPENNAAVLLWQAVDPRPISAEFRDRFFKELGAPNLAKAGEQFISFDSFVRARDAKEPPADNDSSDDSQPDREMDRALAAPWSKKDCPLVAAWLEANEKSLRLVVEATRRPRYYCPVILKDGDPLLMVGLPLVEASRGAARALAARAMLRAQEGKLQDAWEDLLACHRLARLLGQGPNLVDALVAMSVDGWASSGDRALMHFGKLRAEQLRAMHEQYRRLGPLPGVASKLRAERFMYLDAVCLIAREGPERVRLLTDAPEKKATIKQTLDKWVANAAINWDEVLRIGNGHFDRLDIAAGKPPGKERGRLLDDLMQDIRINQGRIREPKAVLSELLGGDSPRTIASRRMGAISAGLLLPATDAVFRAEDRAATQMQLTDVSFALAAYRADKGQYPQRLAELHPKYLAEMPKDFFTDAEFRYKRDGAGYLLYSLGPNGKDEGGRNRHDEVPPDREPDYEADDIAVRMPPAGGRRP